MTKYIPFPYQQFATDHIIKNKGAGLMLEMGLGKTVAALTAAKQLSCDTGEIKKVLVIAPLRVATSVWPAEIAKWDHLKGITYSLIIGNESQRKKAILATADLYIVNRENIPWLVSFYMTKFPYDMLIVDESSSFKNPKSKRFRALKKVMPLVKRVVILTGTPTPQSYLDLWSQVYLLDRGERLGESFFAYRNKYFEPGGRNGNIIFDYQLKKEKRDQVELLGEDLQEKIIFEKLKDVCISMKTKDYLQLPPRIDRDIPVKLSAEILQQYHQFKRDRVLQMLEQSDQQVTAINAAAVAIKLLQFANGAVYTDQGDYVVVHDEKLERLAELVDTATSPVLVFYSYRHDLDRIRGHLSGFKPVVLRGNAEIDGWNAGKIRVLIAHPASAGHGLNLQAGGNNVLWFGVPAPRSLELYMQGIARLDRIGQSRSVINQRMICQDTLEPLAFEALDTKQDIQDLFMKTIKAEVKKIKL